MSPGRALAGAPFPYRVNSLNMFRLILAALVLFAHSFYIVGAGEGPKVQGENLGGWAVAGFFVLSGFLITRSRLRTAPGEYLLHRIARIFPAFVVCLVVTAFVFAPIAALIERGTLAGFMSTPVTPLQYIWSNLTLYIDSYTIGATLESVAYPGVWNGSLWTLFYEFLCYVLVWLLGGLALFRRNGFMAGVVFVVSLLVWIGSPLAERWGLDGSFLLFAKLAPFFLGGALVFFIVERSGINTIVAVSSLVVALVLIGAVPRWGGQASAPFLAYGLLWLSSVIPQPRWIARNDVSYGFYIYAWPIQQIAVLLGVSALGLPAYMLIVALVTFALAWLSWVFVEHRAMGWARPSSDRLRPLPVGP
ncbi:acyltransferase family protein [Microbacterium aurantiacum]|uniref:acyltransferase family protein n=1 Tax=Microbacterium aurantiacum TaxID=162393 RepID=UPI003F492A43